MMTWSAAPQVSQSASHAIDSYIAPKRTKQLLSNKIIINKPCHFEDRYFNFEEWNTWLERYEVQERNGVPIVS